MLVYVALIDEIESRATRGRRLHALSSSSCLRPFFSKLQNAVTTRGGMMNPTHKEFTSVRMSPLLSVNTNLNLLKHLDAFFVFYSTKNVF